ncbi:unnamed protein product [Auanema sp. JU1783]|nr:unnamed protein product [Auanema sp. JU1783]
MTVSNIQQIYHLLVVVSFSWLVNFTSAQFMESDYVDTTVLSQVLDRLTNRTIYDKRLRPRYGDKPVDVGITIHVSSISAVSEVDMDFTLDFYMRQTWQDPRLAFGDLRIGSSDKPITSLTVGVDYLDKLWKPDTFFPNEKKSFFHVATTHNSFLRIDADGTVYTSQRLTVTATCPMKLQLFPMDSQRCKLEIESYGYSILDIIYVFGQEGVGRAEFELPQFVLVDVKNTNITQKLSSGEYSRLVSYFFFKRNIGFYLIQIYLPSILIVVISWVSFWLSRDATPARVALGVTTVLTMTTLMTTTNSSMPKVSYVKSIDIFLGVCFMMVFCTLLEYAAVGYISKRMKLVESRKNSRAPLLGNSSDDEEANLGRSSQSFFNIGYRPFYSSTDQSSHLFLPEHQRQLVDSDCLCVLPRNEMNSARESRVSFLAVESMRSNSRWYMSFIECIRPSSIDKYSRSIFPTIFVVFNVIYWSYYIRISQDDDLLNIEEGP